MTAAQEDYDTYEGDEDYYDDGEAHESGEHDVQIGEEIVLSHEEVWDDSALIEAWDAAVKQYELYHQDPSGAQQKSRSTIKQQQIRTGTMSKNATSSATSSASRSGPGSVVNKRPLLTNDGPTPIPTSSAKVSSTTKAATALRDTPKTSQPLLSKSAAATITTATKGNNGVTASRKKAKVQHDWTAETQASSSSSSSSTKWPNSEATAPESRGTTYNSYTPQQYAAPYTYYTPPPFVGMPATAGMQGQAPPPMMPWGVPPQPPMFAHPPPPPSSMFVPPFLSSGAATPAGLRGGAGGMDDESLGNLIMAWYYSGYYTGLYQARRQQQ